MRLALAGRLSQRNANWGQTRRRPVMHDLAKAAGSSSDRAGVTAGSRTSGWGEPVARTSHAPWGAAPPRRPAATLTPPASGRLPRLGGAPLGSLRLRHDPGLREAVLIYCDADRRTPSRRLDVVGADVAVLTHRLSGPAADLDARIQQLATTLLERSSASAAA